MKILVLSSLAFSLVNFRGALLAELRRLGHEVVAVAPDRDPEIERKLGEMGIELRIVPMNRTGTRPLQDIRTILSYIRLMAKEKPDLVLAYTQKPIIYGGLAARFHNIPFYALMSGLGYMFSPIASGKTLVRKIMVGLYREGVRKARKIFVFNRDDQADMLAAGIVAPGQPVVQVPGSGVDLNHFQHHPLPADGTIHFLMMGRLMQDKGVFEFLEAARQVKQNHPNTRFSILGRPEDNNPTGISAAEIEPLSRKYPVTFLPGTTDVRPFIKDASVFVLPSFYREGLPRTILEALATGRAVITTDMPGCRDPIEEGENGLLVPPRDAAALAAAMTKLAENPALIEKMGLRSRAIAEQVYDVNKVNRQLLEHMGLLPASRDGTAAGPGATHAGAGADHRTGTVMAGS